MYFTKRTVCDLPKIYPASSFLVPQPKYNSINK